LKIYTRRGDSGQTDLFGGQRVGKDALRVEAYGAVDELNAALGSCAAATQHSDLREMVRSIQGLLFDLGATLATPDPERRAKSGLPEPGRGDVELLEGQIDGLEGELAPLRRFVLPGGCPSAAAFHVARTVCRRAERRSVALEREEALPEACLRLLNRLSDLLFVMARVENRRAGIADVEWEPKR
jgi:cob(I)alamin adenosyltransferase